MKNLLEIAGALRKRFLPSSLFLNMREEHRRTLRSQAAGEGYEVRGTRGRQGKKAEYQRGESGVVKRGKHNGVRKDDNGATIFKIIWERRIAIHVFKGSLLDRNPREARSLNNKVFAPYTRSSSYTLFLNPLPISTS